MSTKHQDFSGSTILVCGGAGFIGSNFIRQVLEENRDVTIANIDKLTYSGNLDNLTDVEKDPRYTFIKGDIADPGVVGEVFERFTPDYVVNFAAETHVDRSIHVGALEFIHTNVEGVFHLLEASKVAGSVRKYVQVSTDEVYGSLPLDSTERFSETTPFAPTSPYSATKAGGDLLCRAYYATWGMPVVVTHCSNNYGPYQYPEKLIPFFVLRMLEGKKLPIYGDGKHVRDWIHVLDHCRALELCLLSGQPGAVYNIGADNEMDNRAIAQLILEHFGKDGSWIEYVAERPGHDRRYAIDSALIRSELGWKPQHDFAKAFRDTIEWYVGHEEWIRRVRERTGVFNPHIDLWRGHDGAANDM